MKTKNKTFFTNTLIIITTSFLIKLLGLANKITITRMLGTDGMRQYVLSFPTIMLFVGFAGMSLNLTISKLVSEATASRKYSPKKLLKISFLIAFIVSIFLIFIYLLLLKPLTINFLKNEDLYYPLLTGVILIPLVGISDGLKGYYIGIKQMQVTSISNLTEQITRISFSIISIILLSPYGVNITTTFCLLALSVGEFCSILFSLSRLKKYPVPKYDNTNGELKAILDMAIPNTFTRIIGSFTYFLEPILYTTILSYLGYKTLDIQNNYTIFDAYTIPLLTFISFLPFAISTAMIPGVSVASASNNQKSLNYYIGKVITFSITPALILSINLYINGPSFMQLIYNTSEGSSLLKPLTFMFVGYYLQIPITGILQATGHSKKVFIISVITHVLKLVLIISLSFIPTINLASIVIATTVCMLFSALVSVFVLFKTCPITLNYSKLLTLLLITFFVFATGLLLNTFKLNYLLTLFITGTIYLLLAFKFKILSIETLKKYRQ